MWVQPKRITILDFWKILNFQFKSTNVGEKIFNIVFILWYINCTYILHEVLNLENLENSIDFFSHTIVGKKVYNNLVHCTFTYRFWSRRETVERTQTTPCWEWNPTTTAAITPTVALFSTSWSDCLHSPKCFSVTKVTKNFWLFSLLHWILFLDFWEKIIVKSYIWSN